MAKIPFNVTVAQRSAVARSERMRKSGVVSPSTSVDNAQSISIDLDGKLDASFFATLFELDAENNAIKAKLPLYSLGAITAGGVGSGSSSGSGSSDGAGLFDVWQSLQGNNDAYANTKIALAHIPNLEISKINSLQGLLDSKAIKADVNNSFNALSHGLASALSISESNTREIESVNGIIEQELFERSRLLSLKVDKEEGKGLSTNDFTSALLTKLNGIAIGAEVNVFEGLKFNGSSVSLTDKIASIIAVTTVTTVQGCGLAASGSYNSISGAITLGLSNGFQIPQSSWISEVSTAIAEINGKLDKSVFEELFEKEQVGNSWVIKAKLPLYSLGAITSGGVGVGGSGSSGGAGLYDVWQSLTNNSDSYVDTKINSAHIPNLAISKINGLQTALDGKSGTNHNHDNSYLGLHSKADSAAVADSATSADSVAWSNISGKPATFSPSSHSHSFGSLSSKPTTLSGYGITDAGIVNGVITLGGSTIIPLTQHQSLDDYFTKNEINPRFQDIETAMQDLDEALQEHSVKFGALSNGVSILRAMLDSHSDEVETIYGRLDEEKNERNRLLSGCLIGAKLNGTDISVNERKVNINAVTSITTPTGLTAGSLQANGTLVLSFASGYSLPTTAKQNGWDSSISTINGNITNLQNNKLDKSVFDTYFAFDEANQALKVKVPLYSTGSITAGGIGSGSSGGSGGGTGLYDVWQSLTNNSGSYVDTKINSAHIPNLAISKINGLQTALDGKSGTNHNHDNSYLGLHSKADSAAVADSATSADSVAWSNISGKPATFSPSSHSHSFESLSSKPTTLSGYGVTDAKIVEGVITLGSKTITPLTQHQSLDDYSTKANTIKSLSISGKTISYTKGDGSTGAITTQDTTYAVPSATNASGLFTWAEKQKLEGIAEGANNYTYTLPTASSSQLGGVKIGSFLSISSGVVSVSTGSTSSTVCAGNDARLTDSRNAKDVSAWAKASTKPSYNTTEVTEGNNKYFTEARAKSALTNEVKALSEAITRLVGINETNADSIRTLTEWIDSELFERQRLLGNKVDKVSGKELSTNDFTTAYKNLLDTFNNMFEMTTIGGVQTIHAKKPIYSSGSITAGGTI